MSNARKKVVGKKFGMLTVLQDTTPPARLLASGRNIRNRYVLCQCDCGRQTSVRVDHLRLGKTQSCGCVAAARLWNRGFTAIVAGDEVRAAEVAEKQRMLSESAQDIAEALDRETMRREEEAAARPRQTEAEMWFGMPAGDYERILGEQGGACAVCQEPPTTKALAVDHDHATGRVRGLLCSRCNLGLGHFRDDIMLMARAMKYLSTA